jgi:4-hydroxythreonine-4-phosphate dehydrogenase
MGDAAGIGPEIIIKALARPAVASLCRPLLVGDLATLQAHLRFWPGDRPPVLAAIRDVAVQDIAAWAWPAGVVPVWQPGAALPPLPVGQLSAAAGRGAVEYVLGAVVLAKQGAVAGIVTAPLNKEAIHLAGYTYPGHTELLAEQYGVRHYSLVLAARGQFVFHVTTHVSLRQALDLISGERILGQVRLAHLLAKALGRGDETIAVAAINPHAGEGGLFGSEESEIIAPALATARAEGIPVVGPLPADVLFPRAARGRYAFVIAMYHDQGHAVFKTLYFDEGVNVTVGLPVIRTSVDHGTAFDIAGQGVASDESMVEAIQLAARLGPAWAEICAAARVNA